MAAPTKKPGLSPAALARVFNSLPHALDGKTLTVTYPSLAAYSERAQDDMGALCELVDVRESSLSALTGEPSAYQGAGDLEGPQRLVVLLA